MSRSLNDLRYELKDKGEVRIPQGSPFAIIGILLAFVVLVCAGLFVLWIAPFNWGILSFAATLWVCAIGVSWMNIRHWRKHVTVTSTHLRTPGERPILWSDIESIRTPVAKFVLSIQLSREGFLRHFDQTDPDFDELEFLASAEDRILVWDLSETIAPDELRFLREQSGLR